MTKQPVLVSGATGYVGGRLVPILLEAGYRVRVLGRSLSKLRSRAWAKHANLEMAEADFLDYESLRKAAEGCWAAFYLVHSMNPRYKDFAQADRSAARNMAKAASVAGLERIIYLGGLGIEGETLSKHLRSRTEVARILQSGECTHHISAGRHDPGLGKCIFRNDAISGGTSPHYDYPELA